MIKDKPRTMGKSQEKTLLDKKDLPGFENLAGLNDTINFICYKQYKACTMVESQMFSKKILHLHNISCEEEKNYVSGLNNSRVI